MFDLLADKNPVSEGSHLPWTHPETWWPRLTEATAHLSAPVAVIDRDALRHNALDLVIRAAGRPIRVASKSVRVRAVLDAVLALPGYSGILAFTLEEALWLADTHEDIVVGYPTVDRAALSRLLAGEELAQRITLMIDDVAQLDLIDTLASPTRRATIRVAIDVDASWRSRTLGHIGVRRSPLFTADDTAALARTVTERAGFELVGLQMYEAQLAGQPDNAGLDAPVIRFVQSRSREELALRRAKVVAAVTQIAPLEFVNGGGTGSLEFTAADSVVTEVSAGSGLLAGHLFDGYQAFAPAPASAFACDVVRKPVDDIATVLGGGWVASGPALASRQPAPTWPLGLSTLPREAAGEVQTPVTGHAARNLAIGDRVWFRHAKSGEAAERTDKYQLVAGEDICAELPTYRGEGKAFL